MYTLHTSTTHVIKDVIHILIHELISECNTEKSDASDLSLYLFQFKTYHPNYSFEINSQASSHSKTELLF